MRPQPEAAARVAGVEPLGPDSLMWRYFGDHRNLLVSLWAGSMQNMYPQLGAGVEEHSRFFEERWERLFRSTYPIGGCVYDGDRAGRTAREIVDYHRTIKGVDRHGRPYSALNPETFFWAHATFIMVPVLTQQHFGTPLTRAQKEQLYAEGVRWWQLYGLTMRVVPKDWDAFEAYWDEVVAHQLEDNKAARDVLDLARITQPPLLQWLPDPVWALLRVGLARQGVWLATGLYPEPVRELLGLHWRRRDELALRALGRAVSAGWRLVPRERRYHARASSAMRRADGRLPADAPLTEAPARYLPPPAERGKPTHYCPVPH